MGPGFPNPFGFDFSQIMRMLQSQGPVNLDVAKQVAGVIATSDPQTGQPGSEPAVDAAARDAFEQLVRAAQSMVATTTGISEALAVPMRTVNRQEWSIATTDGLATVFAALAGSLSQVPGDTGDDADESTAAEDAMFGMLMQQLMPVLLGVWAGSMVGQLSHLALGQYDLPLPLDGSPQLLFVNRNVEDFAREWELPLDEVRYAIVLREAVRGALRSVPWVRDRLIRLASEYVGAYEVQVDALEEQLGGIDFTNPEAMQSLGGFGDAGALLGAMQSERQGPMLEELQRYVSVLEGYTDVVVETLGEKMVSTHGRIDEALRRHRLDRGNAASFVDRLLGLELDRQHYERGVAFSRGAVERAGIDGLNRLWEGESMVPTAAEFEAPGLWLARIELTS